MEKITLHQLLPAVFAGMEDESSVAQSQVWLRNIEFARGCRTLISADSGTGKSSLVSFIYGRRNDYMGHIQFDGNDIKQLGVNNWCSLRAITLSLLPQELSLFPELTALENVEIKNRLTHHRSTKWIADAFESLGIADRANVAAGRMSVGQQQRVAIIRALCQPFDFLLLDEPVSHLDNTNNTIAAALIEREATACGAGVIVTSVGNHLKMDYKQTLRL
ncbi:MAG: ATP-binding cassette domain-containing protein [Muribaculaceae bacterium]|nr:ATP-binding cassette domain-containing protein [Muribaculaceae bacterium]